MVMAILEKTLYFFQYINNRDREKSEWGKRERERKINI